MVEDIVITKKDGTTSGGGGGGVGTVATQGDIQVSVSSQTLRNSMYESGDDDSGN